MLFYRIKKILRALCVVISICFICIILAVSLCMAALKYHKITRQAFSKRMVLAKVLDDKIIAQMPLDSDGDIRKVKVGLANTDFSSIYHDSAVVTGEGLKLYKGYDLNDFSNITECDLSLAPDSLYKVSDGQEKICVYLDSINEGELYRVSGDGKLCLESISRKGLKPTYEGDLYIYRLDRGLVICNELELETYLYYVIPSEMPPSYPFEALKAQAVCARSFAINQMEKSVYKNLHFDLVDNTNSQMYNNTETDERVKKAVDETKGEVIVKANSIITAYYYASSCGVSAMPCDIWGSNDYTCYAYGLYNKGGSVLKVDLSTEDAFKEFIDNTRLKKSVPMGNISTEKVRTYEMNDPMYRWKCSVDNAVLSANFIVTYDKEYSNNVNHLWAMVDGEYTHKKLALSGNIRSISVTKRGETGVVKEIVVDIGGTRIKIEGCELIRRLLYADNYTITMNNNYSQPLKMLPSGFYYPIVEGDKISFKGGGFGHGVGMSQNGAYDMANDGFTYRKIIKCYYPGTSIENDQSVYLMKY